MALSNNQTHELTAHLREIAASGMPLAAGFRAAAEETGSRRLARSYRRIAAGLDAGAAWEDLFLRNVAAVPSYVLGVIQAGMRAGDLPGTLDALADQQRIRRDVRRKVRGAIAYPITLMAALTLLYGLAYAWLVPLFRRIFDDFDTELPAATRILLQSSEQVVPFLAVAVVSLVAVCFAVRAIGGPVTWARLVSSIPLFGPLIHWAGVTEMSRLLQILVQQHVPLPEALEITARGVADANVADVTRWLARGTRDGLRLASMIEATPRLPGELLPVLSRGQSTGRLDEALANVTEMFEARIQLRVSLLNLILPPLILIVVAGGVCWFLVALFLPLVALVQNLL